MKTKQRRNGRYISLAAWRQAEDISQREAARRLGITQAYYCMLEQARQHPRPKLLKSISDKTGVPVEILLGIAS